ncbi:MAG: hypothetical protein ACUVQG_14790 [Thermogutta sp.]
MLDQPCRDRRSFLSQCGGILCWSAMGMGAKALGASELLREGSNLAFRKDQNSFAFDTGLVCGLLRRQGRPLGIGPLYCKGYAPDLSQPYGICSHYRLLDAEARYGVAAWEWPGTAELLPDGGVKASWVRDGDHPFDLQAIYRWQTADTLDVLTTVTAAKRLQRFEVFLASYFQGFADSFVYVAACPATGGVPGFFKAEEKNGIWQMFPRDETAIQTIRDGRWLRPPHPVEWAIMPTLAYPLAMRRDADTGLVAVIMSRPSDCFAVATPYSGEGHRSIYLSLFGQDLEPERPVTVHARFVIGHALTDQMIVDRYHSFLAEAGSGPTGAKT